MALGKNIVHTSILTVSNYLVPLVIFPYVSRVLGVINIGKYGFVESVVNFVMLFSMFGIYNLGIREIAKSRNDEIALNKTFSSLFIVNAINTVLVFVCFIILINTIGKFKEFSNLLYFGSFNIIFNLFLIQWFFIGLEKIGFVVYRTIILRIIYVAAILLLVKTSEDYNIYYILSVIFVFINSLVNWIYSKKFVRLSFKNFDYKPFIGPYFRLGLYTILTALYTTFTVTYLGLIKSSAEVGVYSTAVKVQGIFMALFTAVSTAVVPHISNLVGKNDVEAIKQLIKTILKLLLSIGIPIVILTFIFASDIIFLISGPGYEDAIVPLKIVIPTIVVIGLAQIVVLQILMPFGKDNVILKNAVIGAIVGLFLNFVLIPKYGAIGSACVWLASETLVLTLSHFAVKSRFGINIFGKQFWTQIVWGIPYIFIGLFVSWLDFTPILALFIVGVLSLIYFLTLNLVIVKNEIFLGLFRKFVYYKKI